MGYNSSFTATEVYNGSAWVIINGVWTTATRPTTPPTGTIGYNTTTGQIEAYNATYSTWANAGTTGIQYAVSYLIVAGGGGGAGRYYAGGGGAGGLLTSTANIAIGTTYSITVGAGGAGGASFIEGTSGSNSTALGLTAIGGGGGGTNVAGQSGGSGGGSPSGTSPGGSGTTGQGTRWWSY